MNDTNEKPPVAVTPVAAEPIVGTQSDNASREDENVKRHDIPLDEQPGIAPIEDKLTLDHEPGHGPTGGDGRPDGFVPGDQTAAGALTPDGGKHPGEPSGIPGERGNLLDPYGVNSNQQNQMLNAEGGGIENPWIDEDPNLQKKDADEKKDADKHND